MEQEENIDACIIDISWNRVYLNMIIKGKNIREHKLYLASKIYRYEIDLEKIDSDKYQATINITNLNGGDMLQNANYAIQIKKNEEIYEAVAITPEVGYKLGELDRIYRYYKDCYAYTINFDIQQMQDERITCIIKSRFMQINQKPKSYCKIKTNRKLKSFEKNLLQNIGKTFLISLYRLGTIVHINKKNKILLMSETRSPISGNLKALDERMKERGIDKTHKISYSFSKTLEQNKRALMLKWIKTVWLISKQSYIFVDDYSPIFKFIKLSKKTKLIQVWHAGVGFKSVGYARFGFGGPEPYNSCHRKYDYAIVGSKALIPVYEEVFGIAKEKILPYGLPRLDNYLNEEHIHSIKEKLYQEYPEIKDKKMILFAPTFRGAGQKQAYYPYEKLDMEAIFDLCNEENYIFVMKMHPFIKEKIDIPEKYQERIKDFSTYTDINDLLYLTDILITDYSSNIYDYSLLNRPIILYTFDLDQYQLTNRTQRPIKEYAPGKVCMNFDEVIETIKNKDFCLDKLQKYRKENFDNIGANSSDLIIDNIILEGEKNSEKDINSMC